MEIRNSAKQVERSVPNSPQAILRREASKKTDELQQRREEVEAKRGGSGKEAGAGMAGGGKGGGKTKTKKELHQRKLWGLAGLAASKKIMGASVKKEV